jgi:hypothetical protein
MLEKGFSGINSMATSHGDRLENDRMKAEMHREKGQSGKGGTVSRQMGEGTKGQRRPRETFAPKLLMP